MGEEAKLHNIIHTGIWRSALSNLSEGDGLILGRPVPTQTTVLACFHCQHLRFESNVSMLHSQFLFPLFFPQYDLSSSKIPVSLSSPKQSELKKYYCREQTQTQMPICTQTKTILEDIFFFPVVSVCLHELMCTELF